jgi:hypothetical protein
LKLEDLERICAERPVSDAMLTTMLREYIPKLIEVAKAAKQNCQELEELGEPHSMDTLAETLAALEQ